MFGRAGAGGVGSAAASPCPRRDKPDKTLTARKRDLFFIRTPIMETVPGGQYAHLPAGRKCYRSGRMGAGKFLAALQAVISCMAVLPIQGRCPWLNSSTPLGSPAKGRSRLKACQNSAWGSAPRDPCDRPENRSPRPRRGLRTPITRKPRIALPKYLFARHDGAVRNPLGHSEREPLYIVVVRGVKRKKQQYID